MWAASPLRPAFRRKSPADAFRCPLRAPCLDRIHAADIMPAIEEGVRAYKAGIAKNQGAGPRGGYFRKTSSCPSTAPTACWTFARAVLGYLKSNFGGDSVIRISLESAQLTGEAYDAVTLDTAIFPPGEGRLRPARRGRAGFASAADARQGLPELYPRRGALRARTEGTAQGTESRTFAQTHPPRTEHHAGDPGVRPVRAGQQPARRALWRQPGSASPAMRPGRDTRACGPSGSRTATMRRSWPRPRTGICAGGSTRPTPRAAWTGSTTTGTCRSTSSTCASKGPGCWDTRTMPPIRWRRTWPGRPKRSANCCCRSGDAAARKGSAERAELESFAVKYERDSAFRLEPWDVAFYSNKLRKGEIRLRTGTHAQLPAFRQCAQ